MGWVVRNWALKTPLLLRLSGVDSALLAPVRHSGAGESAKPRSLRGSSRSVPSMSTHRLILLVALNANLAAVRHLTPVPDPKPPPRLAERGEAQPSTRELERWATVLRVDCVR